MNQLWTEAELREAIKAYFKMLDLETSNTKFVKSEMNKELQKKLPLRNQKSIEYRWQNISAVLDDYKLKYIKGYKPARNVGINVKNKIWAIINDLKLL